VYFKLEDDFATHFRLTTLAPFYELPHGHNFATKGLYMRHRRFGIWLLVSKKSFEDPRIWREDSQSYALQTLFQRRVGVKYVGKGHPRFPDSFTGFGTIGPRHRARSMAMLFHGHFRRGPVRPQSFSLLPGYRAVLARATGYAIISSVRLRAVNSPGAVFVGSMRTCESQ
jgi:hypothetical protein